MEKLQAAYNNLVKAVKAREAAERELQDKFNTLKKTLVSMWYELNIVPYEIEVDGAIFTISSKEVTYKGLRCLTNTMLEDLKKQVIEYFQHLEKNL